MGVEAAPTCRSGRCSTRPVSDYITAGGDINQEDITNNAVRAWRKMKCFRFSLTDNPGVNHFVLPVDDSVLSA